VPIGAVITAGGLSSRLGAVGQVLPKGLLPLTAPRVGKPAETAIGRIIAALRAGGATAIVIAATDHPWFDAVAAFYGIGKVVVPPTGEYDAFRLGHEQLPPCETVVVVSSDNVFPGAGLEQFVQVPTAAVSLVAAAWKPGLRRYTAVATRDGHVVTGLVEKPDTDAGGLAKAGAYRFPGAVAHELARRPVDADRFGERSMTEALLRVLAGGTVLAFELSGSFLDIGTPDGLAEAIATLRDPALTA
jgi:dTDP-glucose pyrophosphorylase